MHLISHLCLQGCKSSNDPAELPGMRNLALKQARRAIELHSLSLPPSRGWGGRKERVELGKFPDSAVVRSFTEALLLPLLIGCGNGEASRRQDGGRLISSSRRSEVSGNERQRRGMQIAGGFMEQFLLSEQIPDKWAVNKASKAPRLCQLLDGDGYVPLTGSHPRPGAGVPAARTPARACSLTPHTAMPRPSAGRIRASAQTKES